MDFRKIDPHRALRLSETKVRNLYQCTPRIPVQIPRASTCITLGTFGYNVLIRLSETNRAHSMFISWVNTLDTIAASVMAERGEPHTWTSTIKGFGDDRSMYFSLDNGTTVFGSDRNLLAASPCSIVCADCLVEVAGVWTSPTHTGLRWKVVQFKQSLQPPPRTFDVPAFLEDESDALP